MRRNNDIAEALVRKFAGGYLGTVKQFFLNPEQLPIVDQNGHIRRIVQDDVVSVLRT